MDTEDFIKEKAASVDKAVEKYIPRILSEDAVLFRSDPPRFAYNLAALNKAISDPIWEFLDRGGKRWRSTLFILTIEALGKDPEDFADFAVIPEIIHNGTIIVDDIEDSSELRRGKPCTYKIFGLDVAINAGNAMYYLPLLSLIENMGKLSKEQFCEICKIYIREMMNLSLGQAVDIAWHRGMVDAADVDEDGYLQMCAYKTGTLARMAAKIAAVMADANDEVVESIGRFAESLGIAFQMQDDILDLTGTEFSKKKGGIGQDITEGKKSLIAIHTLNVADAEDRERLAQILRMHTSDQTLRDEAIAIMEKYGSIEYVRQFSKRIVEENWREVERLLPANPAKKRLEAFTSFLIQRKI